MSMRLSRVSGTFNIGVAAAANESLAFVTTDADERFVKDLEEVLGVETIMTTVSGSHVPGALISMNSNGIAMPEISEASEIELAEKYLPVVLLPDWINAAGNVILANDHGAVVSPEMNDATLKAVEDAFCVEAVRSQIAGYNTVGSVCRCTNKGCVCTTDATDDDVELLKEVLHVGVQRSTVNHGAKCVGSGIVANSKGALIGDETTPIEMGRIEDGLFY